ncbi:hypothetical protein [Gilliamella sp. wkB112]|uniref:hypothetical protein n=1 Tax=Gilliamella sp. wkB112 TaxID=3120257 RepID=UPI00080E4D34|nr:hypothetical protein [Gilliamella apicola]OCG00771.1 hypothetical protein A9G12_03130 [Gilliamella apicola]
MSKISIRIAGNTEAACFYAIQTKGYQIDVSVHYLSDDDTDCLYQFDAQKDNLYFSATDPIELLGLICLWEVRGNNWLPTKNEASQYLKIRYDAPTYDKNNNLIED